MNDALQDRACAPNHHAHYPGFSGLTGLVAALSMLVGRSGDAELALRLSGAGPGDTVVDIGCGPGSAVRHAARRGATVMGVDPAPIMLQVARVLTSRRAAVQYVLGSAEALELPDQSATVVWTIASVHHWSDLDAGLREITRVLCPGGRFVAIERLTSAGARGHASHGWTPERAAAFAGLCTRAGFLNVRIDRSEGGRRAAISVTADWPDE
jgi:SAM-dependent methyltransferase